MDIAQLPNLPEKTSESSETSDSESESKENSGRNNGSEVRRETRTENGHIRHEGSCSKVHKTWTVPHSHLLRVLEWAALGDAAGAREARDVLSVDASGAARARQRGDGRQQLGNQPQRDIKHGTTLQDATESNTHTLANTKRQRTDAQTEPEKQKKNFEMPQHESFQERL